MRTGPTRRASAHLIIYNRLLIEVVQVAFVLEQAPTRLRNERSWGTCGAFGYGTVGPAPVVERVGVEGYFCARTRGKGMRRRG